MPRGTANAMQSPSKALRDAVYREGSARVAGSRGLAWRLKRGPSGRMPTAPTAGTRRERSPGDLRRGTPGGRTAARRRMGRSGCRRSARGGEFTTANRSANVATPCTPLDRGGERRVLRQGDVFRGGRKTGKAPENGFWNSALPLAGAVRPSSRYGRHTYPGGALPGLQGLARVRAGFGRESRVKVTTSRPGVNRRSPSARVQG